MPTRTTTVGDKTTYDEVGELDEDLPEGPGYSDEPQGCFGQAAMIALVVCLIMVIL